jgi:putative SOS response-associated peptidase YedK
MVHTYTVITTQANPLMEKIHNKKKRMPVILRKEDEQQWIRSILDKDLTKSLLNPYDYQKMEAYTISHLITSRTQNPNTPQVLEPYTYPGLQPTYGQKKLE